MASRRRRADQQRRILPETGAWGFGLVSLILIIIIYFGRDYYGIRLGGLGVYLWAMGVALSFGLTLLYYALFLLPKRGSQGWNEALRLLGTFYYKQALRIISFTKKPKAVQPTSDALAIPASFAKVQAGIVESHQAAAMSVDGSFIRADGPGYVKLTGGETVRELVDLRKQLRTMKVNAVTRDGIPIETVVVTIFQVRPSPPQTDPPDRQYWYNEDAIFQALYAGPVDAERVARHWTERPAPAAAAHLVATLATYTLDELIQPLDPQATPIEDVKAEVKRLVAAELEPHGIDLIAVALSQFSLPENVVEERINVWQAQWERQIRTRQAADSAEAWRRIQLARARAQMEMIDSITSSIEAMSRRGDVDISEIITLRMIEALKTAVRDDAVKALLPGHILNSLDQVQDWLVEPPQIVSTQRLGE